MILVEIVKLIVEVNWGSHGGINGELDRALAYSCTTVRIIVVLLHCLLDLVTHGVEHNPKSQEDYSEDSEGDHGRSE